MNTTQNLYQILGVSKDASMNELKSVYRKLAKKYHPDAHPGDAECEKIFREMNEAYTILSDPTSRKKYDEECKGKRANGSTNQGTASRTAHQGEDKTEVDFEQIHKSFETFFGFHPQSKEIINENKVNPKERNPLDTSKLFEQFMGMKR